MRYRYFLLLLVIPIMIFSCKGDNEAPERIKKEILDFDVDMWGY